MQTSSATDSNDQTSTPSEGQKLAGCYVLKKDLSSAECGTIWLAHDEVLGKDVSLHFVPSAILKDPRALAELRQEVKRNRQLIHPNILRVYDFVEDGPFAAISMDRFEGESLATLLKAKGHFEPQEAHPWLVQIAETLSDAHRIQLIHRDLAPSNLYLRPTGGILIVNFGLARAVRDAMERVGLAKGAEAHLAYTSPQQIDGDKAVVADDVYGLGALAFELLTGRSVFVGDDIVSQIRKGTPPSLADARGGAAVPAALETIVSSCLAKSAEQRPKTCGEVASILSQNKSDIVAPAKTEPAPSNVEVRQRVVEQSAKTDTPVPQLEMSEVENVTSSTVKSTLPPLPPASPAKKLPQNLPSSFPDLERPRSKAPAVLVALAAVALAVGIYLRNHTDEAAPGGGAVSQMDGETSAKPTIHAPKETPPVKDTSNDTVAKVPEQNPDGSVAQINPAAPEKPPKKAIIGVELPQKPEPSVSNPPTPPPKPEIAKTPPLKSEVKPAPEHQPEVAVALSLPAAPAPLPKLSIPAGVTSAQLEQLLAERQAAADKQRDTAQAADAIHKKASAERESKQADNEQLKKALDEKRKILTPIIAQGAALEAERKKLEEAMQKTKAAMEEAIKASEAAGKAFEDHKATAGEKLAARQKADIELHDIAQQAAERAKALDETNKIITQAESLRQQMQLAMRQSEQDKTALTTALVKIKATEEAAQVKAKAAEEAALAKAKAAEEAAQAKAKATAEEESRKLAREQIAKLEEQVKPLDAQTAKFKAALTSLAELGEAGIEPAKQIQVKLDAVTAQATDIRSQIKKLASPGNVVAPNVQKPPTPVATPTPKPASVKTAVVTESKVLVDPAPSAETVAPTEPGVNSLGMKFVPIGDVQFAVYPTTRKDFEVFAKATSLKNRAWQSPSFEQGPDHPVVNVTWREADAFCKWLTDKERKAGLLKAGEHYRLPGDLEWSKAIGLPAETGRTPLDRDMDVPNIYPWGTQWPPPAGAGNFLGEETRSENAIEGYNDGFARTSPVGKFKPTSTGLYDMSGNVWQWVADDWNDEHTSKTLRGGSWYNGALSLTLLSSSRIPSSPDSPNDCYGFRIVKATEPVKGKR